MLYFWTQISFSWFKARFSGYRLRWHCSLCHLSHIHLFYKEITFGSFIDKTFIFHIWIFVSLNCITIHLSHGKNRYGNFWKYKDWYIYLRINQWSLRVRVYLATIMVNRTGHWRICLGRFCAVFTCLQN